VIVTAALFEALALWSLPRTWTRREESDARVRAGDVEAADEALRLRPLDATLHEILARGAGERGAWQLAATHARAATSQRPGSADAWLLLAAAEAHVGRQERSRSAFARALEVVHAPLDPSLVGYLLQRFPEPKLLSSLLPVEPSQWLAVVESVGARDPVYGGVLVALRGRNARTAALLVLQSTLALQADNAALALHAARLLRARAPADVRGPTLIVSALRRFPREREREIQRVLGDALAGGEILDGAALGMLEERLVGSLMVSRTPRDLDRADALLSGLARRPGTREQLRHRQALRRELDALLAVIEAS
jgi:tetratricopeptide (TPR) repeat protein